MMPLDKILFAKARKHLVGGVNSPVRSFRSVGGTPVFIKKGAGAFLYGENGNRYVDLCLSWGAMILGHAHPRVTAAIRKAAATGASFGAASKGEAALAQRIRAGIPSMERVRFTNSGTEAVMTALRLARAFTKKSGVIKFEGCYHGHADSLLAKAGSGAFALPESSGVPKTFTRETIVLPYNDLGRVAQALKRHHARIAAIIVEPVAGNMGVILPRKGFLEGLRKLCDTYRVVLIFDEVITGFRLCYGGAQNYFGVTPDLTTLGKIIGGGLPIGALGGPKEIMKLLAPEGPVYQAGTFSGNPVAMAAGIATLDLLKRPVFYRRLWRRSEAFYRHVRAAAEDAHIALQLNAIGPMFSCFFTGQPVTDAGTARRQNVEAFRRFFHASLRRGVYLSPSPFEADFISSAHDERTLAGVAKVLKDAFLKI